MYIHTHIYRYTRILDHVSGGKLQNTEPEELL